MTHITNLLKQVNLISKKNAEILDATGSRFNLFRICGVNHYENTHSAIIAELLDPNGTHGLKSKLLECFLETLGDYCSMDDFRSHSARVMTEYTTTEGRIDILIEDNDERAIIIENKIYAGDQHEQLIRYDRFAKKYRNGYQILYLTLLGDSASDQSSAGVTYLSISHKEHIINWLEKCIACASRFPIVRETINQYINHLKQLTNQDMDTKNREEITEILSNIENLQAAKTIFQNYAATFSFILSKSFNPNMEAFATQYGLDYHFERCEESYIRFHLTSASWQGKIWIGFTYEGGRCHYGLVNNPKLYRLPAETRQKIHDELQMLGITERKESDWWPFYAAMPNLSLEKWESDVIKTDGLLRDYQNKIELLLRVIEKIEL